MGPISSYNNWSYKDMRCSTAVAKQVLAHGLKRKSKFTKILVSKQIYTNTEQNGYSQILQDMVGIVLANTCGPCIAQQNRKDIMKGEKKVTITSYKTHFTNITK